MLLIPDWELVIGTPAAFPPSASSLRGPQRTTHQGWAIGKELGRNWSVLFGKGFHGLRDCLHVATGGTSQRIPKRAVQKWALHRGAAMWRDLALLPPGEGALGLPRGGDVHPDSRALACRSYGGDIQRKSMDDHDRQAPWRAADPVCCPARRYIRSTTRR